MSNPSEDPVPDREQLEKAAAQGDVDSMRALAAIHRAAGGPKDKAKAMEWYEKAAEQERDAQSMWKVGWMHQTGECGPRDKLKAEEWYKKWNIQMNADSEALIQAAEKGDTDAQFELGMNYDTNPQLGNAVEWFQKAAENGHAAAQFKLGESYAIGFGVPKDEVKAVEWYEKSAAKGDVNAQCSLGVMYCEGRGIPVDVAKGIEWFEKVIARGTGEFKPKEILHGKVQGWSGSNRLDWIDSYRIGAAKAMARAQTLLAIMFMEGKGVPKNEYKAVELFHKAATQGDARGQNGLGMMYRDGRGVEEDEHESLEWFKKAAAQGDFRAEYNLGRCYLNGEGVEEDWSMALEWFEKAAAQGLAEAQFAVGAMHADSSDIFEKEESLEWFEKAAAQGHARAQFRLGAAYFNGIDDNGVGFSKDDSKAVELFQKAAAQGWAAAQFNLGLMYANGEGIPKNDIRAYAWLSLAAAQSESNASEIRDGIEKQMTLEQKAEAQKLAAELFQKIQNKGSSTPNPSP